VIIDAAAAFGNQLDPGPTCAVFSLHATKPLAAGEGGVVVTHDAAFAATVRQLSNFGIDLSGAQGVPVGSTTLVGTNAKMSEYHAAVGLASLDIWPQTVVQRHALFARYSETLMASSGAQLHWQQMPTESVRSVCCLMLQSAAHRNHAEAVMAERGIATRRWYLPLINQHPAFQHIQHLPTPCAEKIALRLIGIPFHAALSDQDMIEIAQALALAT